MAVITIPEPTDTQSLKALEYARERGFGNSFQEIAVDGFQRELSRLFHCRKGKQKPKKKITRPYRGRPATKKCAAIAEKVRGNFETVRSMNTFTERHEELENLFQTAVASNDLTILRWFEATRPWLNPEQVEIPIFGSMLAANAESGQ